MKTSTPAAVKTYCNTWKAKMHTDFQIGYRVTPWMSECGKPDNTLVQESTLVPQIYSSFL